jgi:hypothetical protein
LDRNIDRAAGRTGQWTEDEKSKLKDAVQMHGGKDWFAVAALVWVEQRDSVMTDGMMSWIPTSTERLLDVRLNGQKTKTAR